MRIIHDIEGPTQVFCGGSPYRNIIGWHGYIGMRAEIFISTEDDSEAIYIEGHAEYVKQALRNALNALESIDSAYGKQMGERTRLDCPNCDPEKQYPNATHHKDCKIYAEKRLKVKGK